MINRMTKKEHLYKLIENGEVRTASLAVVPTTELTTAMFNGHSDSVLDLFKKYEIENKMNKYEATAVSVYYPTIYKDGKRLQASELAIINININGGYVGEEDGNAVEIPTVKDAIEQIEKIIVYLAKDVLDYYQASIIPALFDEMLNQGISFSDMLLLMPENNQTKIAEAAGVKRAVVTDYKAGRKTPSVKVVSKLMNAFPLLPWDHYIGGLKND